MTVNLYHVRPAPASAHANPCTSTSTAPQSRAFSLRISSLCFRLIMGKSRRASSSIQKVGEMGPIGWSMNQLVSICVWISEQVRRNWRLSLGSRLILSLKDANGGQGRYLPHIFEVVGESILCDNYTINWTAILSYGLDLKLEIQQNVLFNILFLYLPMYIRTFPAGQLSANSRTIPIRCALMSMEECRLTKPPWFGWRLLGFRSDQAFHFIRRH